MRSFLMLCVVASMVAVIDAECANACSGHGKCTSYDMCICNRNWQANDCSERVCQFGLAHVDTPKGDLDHSGGLSGPNQPVIENHFTYPYGTTEQFPQMQDSDLKELTNSAHYYMECSNKGTCDRGTGVCACYDGYDGVACQRASCPGFPNSCSGHGVCKSIKQLAAADHGNVYKLWDKDVTMGCECDQGYYGPDCSQRKCKYGIDPLYLDDVSTVKYSIFDFAVLTDSTSNPLFTDGQYIKKQGHWAIRFFDAHGEDWVTEPIVAGASCDEVVAALEKLPNNVISQGQTYCHLTKNTNPEIEGLWDSLDETLSKHDPNDVTHMAKKYPVYYNMSLWELSPVVEPSQIYLPVFEQKSSYVAQGHAKVSGYIYRIKFYGNPGKLREPEIEIYLDGKRPSLVANDNKKVITKVWTDGQQGENVDYFADHCDGVTVTIGRFFSGDGGLMNHHYLTGMTLAEKKLLKACLGDADGDMTNNVEVYNWDFGSYQFPHLIKLVRTVTTYSDGGYYAAVWYDSSTNWDQISGDTGTFRLLNPFFPPDEYKTDNYEVYTTKGVLQLTSPFAQAAFGFGSKEIFMTNVTYDNSQPFTNEKKDFVGSVSCELGYPNSLVYRCLNKGDLFTLLSWNLPQYNPPHINLYTAERLIHTDLAWSGKKFYTGNEVKFKAVGMQYMTHVINTDLSTNWGASPNSINQGFDGNNAVFRIYAFTPDVASNYEYVAQCSNRGICETGSGTCSCFPGYTSDACSEQSSIAV